MQDSPQDQQSTAAPGQELGRQQVIESASATTSPDNHAGAVPYVIVGVVLVTLIVLGIGLAAALSSLASIYEREVASGLYGGYGYYYDYDSDDLLGDDSLDDLYDYLEREGLSDLLGNGTRHSYFYGAAHVKAQADR